MIIVNKNDYFVQEKNSIKMKLFFKFRTCRKQQQNPGSVAHWRHSIKRRQVPYWRQPVKHQQVAHWRQPVKHRQVAHWHQLLKHRQEAHWRRPLKRRQVAHWRQQVKHQIKHRRSHPIRFLKIITRITKVTISSILLHISNN